MFGSRYRFPPQPPRIASGVASVREEVTVLDDASAREKYQLDRCIVPLAKASHGAIDIRIAEVMATLNKYWTLMEMPS